MAQKKTSQKAGREPHISRFLSTRKLRLRGFMMGRSMSDRLSLMHLGRHMLARNHLGQSAGRCQSGRTGTSPGYGFASPDIQRFPLAIGLQAAERQFTVYLRPCRNSGAVNSDGQSGGRRWRRGTCDWGWNRGHWRCGQWQSNPLDRYKSKRICQINLRDAQIRHWVGRGIATLFEP